MIRFFTLAIAILTFSGCFQTGLFLKDYILTSPGMDKLVTQLPYRYLGARGPDTIILENERGLRAALKFEAFYFPHFRAWDSLNLKTEDGQALSLRAERAIRDYFGKEQEIFITILNKVAPDHAKHRYLIDARNHSQAISLGDLLVEAGLAQVDHDLARIADRRALINLEDEARRERRGIWRYAPSNNPHWHD